MEHPKFVKYCIFFTLLVGLLALFIMLYSLNSDYISLMKVRQNCSAIKNLSDSKEDMRQQIVLDKEYGVENNISVVGKSKRADDDRIIRNKRSTSKFVYDQSDDSRPCSDVIGNVTRHFGQIDRELKYFRDLLETLKNGQKSNSRVSSITSDEKSNLSNIDKVNRVTNQRINYSNEYSSSLSSNEENDSDDDDDDDDVAEVKKDDDDEGEQYDYERKIGSNAGNYLKKLLEKQTGGLNTNSNGSERSNRDTAKTNLSNYSNDDPVDDGSAWIASNKNNKNRNTTEGWRPYCFLSTKNNKSSTDVDSERLDRNRGDKHFVGNSDDRFSAFSLNDFQRKRNEQRTRQFQQNAVDAIMPYSDGDDFYGTLSNRMKDAMKIVNFTDDADLEKPILQLRCTYLPSYSKSDFINLSEFSLAAASAATNGSSKKVDGNVKFREIANVKMNFSREESRNSQTSSSYEVEEETHFPDVPNICDQDEKLCSDMKSCISPFNWCDGIIHCNDGSDEVHCSCKERIDKSKLCDGYFDCPNGEDESGCFGCSEHSFSCGDFNFWEANSSCVLNTQRCDNHKDCINGKDEKDCVLLSDKVMNKELFLVSYSSGILHRNWKGHWYPACISKSSEWPLLACQAENGPILGHPETTLISVDEVHNTKTTFVLDRINKEPQFVSYCRKQYHVIYISCPDIPCGLRNSLKFGVGFKENLFRLKRTYDNHTTTARQQQHANNSLTPTLTATAKKTMSSNFDNFFKSGRLDNNASYTDNDNIMALLTRLMKGQYELQQANKSRHKRSAPASLTDDDSSKIILNGTTNAPDRDDIDGNGRVVGGQPSSPGQWPWIIALYKNGIFHCGGVILNSKWMMTAAHCVHQHKENYYEIQAGMLRRLSFSPSDQTRTVSGVIVHKAYSRSDMTNDLALLYLAKPLKFNRWVRPVCLPVARYPWGPFPGSMCTAVGWGAIVEHGTDPDNIRDVQVPILAHCKHVSDIVADELCAGFINGGHDTCQGDSGGPLLCRVPENPESWYVAGIVSHGEGCARPMEPGAYTRVALYLSWILENTDESALSKVSHPVLTCPGLKCSEDGRCIAGKRICDKVVDCLNADDELNCRNPLFKLASLNNGKLFNDENSSVTTDNNNPKNDRILDSSGNYRQNQVVVTTEMTALNSMNDDRNRTNSTQVQLSSYPVSTSSYLSSTSKPGVSYSVSPSAYTVVNSIGGKYNGSNNGSSIIWQLFGNSTAHLKHIMNTTSSTSTFVCKQITQLIPSEWLCDGTVECEDSSDESDCGCVDYLAVVNPSVICDGRIHCYDYSDETNCMSGANCTSDEFLCSKSRACIEKESRCDGVNDCEFGEDEKNCYALTDGIKVRSDILGYAVETWNGIITYNSKGVWRPLCFPNDVTMDAIEDACQMLGYSGYDKFEKILVWNHSLPITSKNWNETINGHCTGISVNCTPKHISDIDRATWHADVYSNGSKICPAVLFTSEWIIGSYTCCRYFDVKKDYMTVIVGSAYVSSYLIRSANEQIVRLNNVTCSKSKGLFAAHLSKPVVLSPYVKPIGRPLWMPKPEEGNLCAAVGYDRKNDTIIVRINHAVRRFNCPFAYNCYSVINKTHLCANDKWIINSGGGVVCSWINGWHLAALFDDEAKEFCSSNSNVLKLRAFRNIYDFVFDLTEQRPDIVEFNSAECDGFRCSLGTCISWSMVCDRRPDCRDNEDELSENCHRKLAICKITPELCGCKKDQLTCANGKCVHKSMICDGRDNCGDSSDEPQNCFDRTTTLNCADYLNRTASHKLCDSKVDCEDKTDESLELCAPNCTIGSSSNLFFCNISNACIPREFVCDGERDCIFGEDESVCLSLKPITDKMNEGLLMIRSQGEWSAECISADFASNADMNPICQHLGFQRSVRNHFITSTRSMSKIYTTVKLNVKLEITLRIAKKLASNEPCNQIYVVCE